MPPAEFVEEGNPIFLELAQWMRTSQIASILIVTMQMASIAWSQPPDSISTVDPTGEIELLRSEVEELRRQIRTRTVQSTELAPPPVDPARFNSDSVVRAGDFRGAILLPGTDVSLRIDGYARLDSVYDTGFVGSGIRLFPATIALDGSPLAQRRGKTTLTGGQSRLSFDAQAKTELGLLRGYIELDFLKDDTDLRLRHIFGELRAGEFEVLGGQTWSTFMDPETLPQIVAISAPVGAIFRRPPLLRLTRKFSEGLSGAIAIEDPATRDFTLPDPDNDQFLQRWPDFVARMRLVNQDRCAFQVASLVRGIGFEEIAGRERLRTGWGLSATGRINLNDGNDIRMGVAGGRGIGSYLSGIALDFSAAGPDVGGFRTLGAIGAFGALQHHWTERWQSNLYYGYSNVESTPLMPSIAGDTTHNGGVNLIWSPRPGCGVGLEYTYGLREVRSGITGDNHRIQFAIQFGP